MLRHLSSLGRRALPASSSLRRRAASKRFYSSPAVTAISAPIKRSEGLVLPWGEEPRRASSPPTLWSLYVSSLEQRPLVTKACTSFVMTVLSDSIAQMLGGVAAYSIWRCVCLGLYSASVGALSGHYWHRWLDARCCPEQPKSARAVGLKLGLDQLVFTPVMTCAFLAFLKAAEGQPHMVIPFLNEKLVSTLLAGYTVWPVVNIVSFKYVPGDLRILFGSAVGLFWGTYMSLSCVNATRACPEPGVHVGAMVEGSQPVQVFDS